LVNSHSKRGWSSVPLSLKSDTLQLDILGQLTANAGSFGVENKRMLAMKNPANNGMINS